VIRPPPAERDSETPAKGSLPDTPGRPNADRTVESGAGRRFGLLFAGIGLVVVLGLLLDGDDLREMTAAAGKLPGWLALSAAVHLPQLVLTAAAWQILLGGGRVVSLAWMVLLRWLRESAGMLLPGGGLLGQVAAARMLVQRGVPGDVAGATATVDVTIEAAAQLFVTAIGLLLLLERGVAGQVVHAAAIGLILAALVVVALIGMQRLPPHSPPAEALRALGHRLPVRWRQAVRDTLAAILRLHADRTRLAGAFACHSAAWLLGSIEIVGLLALTGRTIAFTDGLIIETIAQALRSVGFMLPGAVGIQEGAIVGAAALVGVPPGPALTVALVRRGREVLTSLPGLLVWQRMQGRVAVPSHQPAVVRTARSA